MQIYVPCDVVEYERWGAGVRVFEGSPHTLSDCRQCCRGTATTLSVVVWIVVTVLLLAGLAHPPSHNKYQGSSLWILILHGYWKITSNLLMHYICLRKEIALQKALITQIQLCSAQSRQVPWIWGWKFPPCLCFFWKKNSDEKKTFSGRLKCRVGSCPLPLPSHDAIGVWTKFRTAIVQFWCTE